MDTIFEFINKEIRKKFSFLICMDYQIKDNFITDNYYHSYELSFINNVIKRELNVAYTYKSTLNNIDFKPFFSILIWKIPDKIFSDIIDYDKFILHFNPKLSKELDFRGYTELTLEENISKYLENISDYLQKYGMDVMEGEKWYENFYLER